MKPRTLALAVSVVSLGFVLAVLALVAIDAATAPRCTEPTGGSSIVYTPEDGQRLLDETGCAG